MFIFICYNSRIYFIINERLWDPGGKTKGTWKEGNKQFYSTRKYFVTGLLGQHMKRNPFNFLFPHAPHQNCQGNAGMPRAIKFADAVADCGSNSLDSSNYMYLFN